MTYNATCTLVDVLQARLKRIGFDEIRNGSEIPEEDPFNLVFIETEMHKVHTFKSLNIYSQENWRQCAHVEI